MLYVYALPLFLSWAAWSTQRGAPEVSVKRILYALLWPVGFVVGFFLGRLLDLTMNS